MKGRFSLPVAALAALAVVPAALAILPGPRWAPPKMVEALFTVNYPSPKGAAVSEAACLGIGGNKAGGYASFRCQVTWLTMRPPLKARQVTVWARPLSGGRICASTHGPGSCKVVGRFDGVICAPSPWNPPSKVPRCMYAATMRTLSVKLTPIMGGPPSAIELDTCARRGPTTAAPKDPALLDCGFLAYIKQGDGAVLTWSGHAVAHYARRAGGYEILGATVSKVRCRHDAVGNSC